MCVSRGRRGEVGQAEGVGRVTGSGRSAPLRRSVSLTPPAPGPSLPAANSAAESAQARRPATETDSRAPVPWGRPRRRRRSPPVAPQTLAGSCEPAHCSAHNVTPRWTVPRGQTGCQRSLRTRRRRRRRSRTDRCRQGGRCRRRQRSGRAPAVARAPSRAARSWRAAADPSWARRPRASSAAGRPSCAPGSRLPAGRRPAARSWAAPAAGRPRGGPAAPGRRRRTPPSWPWAVRPGRAARSSTRATGTPGRRRWRPGWRRWRHRAPSCGHRRRSAARRHRPICWAPRWVSRPSRSACSRCCYPGRPTSRRAAPPAGSGPARAAPATRPVGRVHRRRRQPPSTRRRGGVDTPGPPPWLAPRADTGTGAPSVAGSRTGWRSCRARRARRAAAAGRPAARPRWPGCSRRGQGRQSASVRGSGGRRRRYSAPGSSRRPPSGRWPDPRRRSPSAWCHARSRSGRSRPAYRCRSASRTAPAVHSCTSRWRARPSAGGHARWWDSPAGSSVSRRLLRRRRHCRLAAAAAAEAAAGSSTRRAPSLRQPSAPVTWSTGPPRASRVPPVRQTHGAGSSQRSPGHTCQTPELAPTTHTVRTSSQATLAKIQSTPPPQPPVHIRHREVRLISDAAPSSTCLR